MSSEDELIADELPIENQLEQVDVDLEPIEQVEADSNDQGEDDQSKKVVKPKRVVRNPQPKLNEQTLREPKGLSAIEGYFERVKFKGRGYEEQDLNVLMKTYEYWCHRLFPKFPFDTCITRLETLGTKRPTIAQINRIRMDLDVEEEKHIESDEEPIPTDGFVNVTSDNQVTSVEAMSHVTQKQLERDQLFDQLLPSTSSSMSTIQITEEQLERIRQNKERAERLRREKLSKINEKAANHLEMSRSCSLENCEGQPNRINRKQLIVNEKQQEESSQTDGNIKEADVDQIMSKVNEEDDIDNILDEINRGDPNENENPVITGDDQEIFNGIGRTSPFVEISKDAICINRKTFENGDGVDINFESKDRTKKTTEILDSDEELNVDMDVDLPSNSLQKRRVVQRIESDDETSS